MTSLTMLFVGCTVAGTDSTHSTGPRQPLDASFVERLTEGYHCGLGWYVSHDDPDHKSSCGGDQEIFHVYDAVAGEAHLEKNGDGTISGTITDLVLEGQDREPIVEVAAMDLPAFGEGEQ